MDQLRSSEIQEMSVPEMDEHITQIKKDLMKINGVLASGGVPEEIGRVREMKKTIARLKTEISKREAMEAK